MRKFRLRIPLLAGSILGAAGAAAVGAAQVNQPISQAGQSTRIGTDPTGNAAPPRPSLLQVPVSKIFPGNVGTGPDIRNPVANDPEAPERGMRAFAAFNCVGCHAPNGAGGMGPALSNDIFLYGSSAANIYLTILQGRPNGMPAWGRTLPDRIVWDLVAYIKSISNEPKAQWGRTISPTSPDYEQVPAEFVKTTQPWKYTQPFRKGQKP
ncbi:MAG TPA: c-type cytochrome [Ferrovibrio sp.]|uniref:c-type cytochrome n=1 Tax=Ferrovibrio sp. TaxID=1917215 RepID=UPI002ED1A579